MYLNASVQTRPGFSLNSLLWSGLVGIKHEIREGFEVYTDILVETGQTVTYELSADVDLSDGWSIGPGFAYSKSYAAPRSDNLIIGIAFSKGF